MRMSKSISGKKKTWNWRRSLSSPMELLRESHSEPSRLPVAGGYTSESFGLSQLGRSQRKRFASWPEPSEPWSYPNLIWARWCMRWNAPQAEHAAYYACLMPGEAFTGLTTFWVRLWRPCNERRQSCRNIPADGPHSAYLVPRLRDRHHGELLRARSARF